MDANNKEVEKFSQLAYNWWNKEGEFKLLHKMNKLRVQYICDSLRKHNIQGLLHILDAGCGGGILSEALAELGHHVTGIDLSKNSIEVAKEHAELKNLYIDYQHTSIYNLSQTNQLFDVICVMEVLEHVENVKHFLHACSLLLKSNGFLFFSTINKTLKSYIQAILGAEFLLRWVPIGTHEWKKFIKPSLLHNILCSLHLAPQDFKGMHYSFLLDEWSFKESLSVNFIGYAIKKAD